MLQFNAREPQEVAHAREVLDRLDGPATAPALDDALMGAAEAAEALGVRVPNLGQVAGLPRPVARLRCGNIYLAREITDFATARNARLARGEARQKPGAAGSQESVAAAAIADLWGRTGPSTHEFIKATADGEFSMADLAVKLGEPPSSIRSRFANLGRPINAMQKAVPGAPKLYVDDKREGVWYFTMLEAYRNIVLRTDLGEPYSDGSLPT